MNLSHSKSFHTDQNENTYPLLFNVSFTDFSLKHTKLVRIKEN